jgi:steroid delta-isomerase-like uncharacterized protein
MDQAAMTQLFRAHRDAEARRDFDAIIDTFTEDCFLETVPLGVRSEGREAARAAYVGYFTAFPDLSPDDHGVAVGDDVLVAWGVLRGTSGGEWLGVPPTGRRFAVPFTNVARFKSGRMEGESIYFDLATLCEQAGLPLNDVRTAAKARRSMNEMEKFLSDTRHMTIEWYKLADTKAQVILGFTGVFLSLVVGASLSSGSDSILVRYMKGRPGSATNVLLLIIPMAFYGASVALSALALGSRGVFRHKKKGIHFFVHLANYLRRGALRKGHGDRLGEAIAALRMDIVRYLNGGEASMDQLMEDVLILSRNTRVKHRLVNLAALLAGCGLVWTLASVVIITRAILRVG